MLFVIDMQKNYIDSKKGKNYIKDSENIVDGIIDKIKESESKGEYIYYTSDIAIIKYEDDFNNKAKNLNNKKSIKIQEINSNKEEKLDCKIYDDLSPYLSKHEKIKKSYYAIPPETLLQIQKRFKEKIHIIKEIEFVGVETHICVLANAICLQSAFPEAKIIIYSSLCKSQNNYDHEYGLKIMEALGMEIRR